MENIYNLISNTYDTYSSEIWFLLICFLIYRFFFVEKDAAVVNVVKKMKKEEIKKIEPINIKEENIDKINEYKDIEKKLEHLLSLSTQMEEMIKSLDTFKVDIMKSVFKELGEQEDMFDNRINNLIERVIYRTELGKHFKYQIKNDNVLKNTIIKIISEELKPYIDKHIDFLLGTNNSFSQEQEEEDEDSWSSGSSFIEELEKENKKKPIKTSPTLEKLKENLSNPPTKKTRPPIKP